MKKLLTIFTFLCLTMSVAAQERTAGRFDNGKMWTFDNPPLQYFQEEYGFQPDAAWFKKAQLGALRFATYCSASFVSPNGLVMTNHHCARRKWFRR
jgi:Peptidase S46